ncbi:MAG: ABC transporter ATP-binding protein [Deltaproteobacteria bacterium]
MTARVELRAASVTYGARAALEGVGLRLEAGERVALLGPNGAGKSTALKLLAGLRRPERGDVLLDGRSLRGLAPREIARSVALVPQAPPVERGLLAVELVQLGLAPLAGAWSMGGLGGRRRVAQAMAETNVLELANRPLATLSGGELRRVLIARALVREPGLLLLDEPLASLDLGAQGQILALARAAARRGAAVLFALHDLNVALREFQRCVVLVAGRVVGDGPPAELLTPARVEEWFGPSERCEGERGPLYFPSAGPP